MSRNIKVAHVTTVDLSLRYLLLNQLRYLQEQGYEVVGVSSAGQDAAYVEGAGIRHCAVPMTRNFTPLADLVSLWRLYRLMRRERFTIVHTHNPKPGLLGQLAARMAGVPIVVNTLHGFYFHDKTPAHWRRFYIALEKIAARCSDVILSQNSEDIETAVREGICARDKIKYLGNGIDLTRFARGKIDAGELERKRAELGIGGDERVVGFVGRLVAEKGVPELLGAARIVLERAKNMRFLFVGPPDMKKEDALTPEIAHDYGIAESCIFTGSRDDMPEMYALMDVFVLPSHREGFPRAPMEASAMGVPAVVTDIRGCREAVVQDVNGALVSLGNVEELAEAILELVTNREKAKRLGENGVRMARERFDERRIFETVSEEYARLITEKIRVDDATTISDKEPNPIS